MSALWQDCPGTYDQNNVIDVEQPQFETQLKYNNCPKSHVLLLPTTICFTRPLALCSDTISTMPSQPPIFAIYHTIEEAMRLFSLTHAKAEQLIAKTDALKQHGSLEPLDDADSADKQQWVDRGYELIVSAFPMIRTKIANTAAGYTRRGAGPTRI